MEKEFEKTLQHREERAAVSYEMDKEKHVLRHMTGRRVADAGPVEYQPNKDPLHPVLIQGRWQDPGPAEREKSGTVTQLAVSYTQNVPHNRYHFTNACSRIEIILGRLECYFVIWIHKRMHFQSHLSEVKSNQTAKKRRSTSCNLDTTRRLYSQPNMVRKPKRSNNVDYKFNRLTSETFLIQISE